MLSPILYDRIIFYLSQKQIEQLHQSFPNNQHFQEAFDLLIQNNDQLEQACLDCNLFGIQKLIKDQSSWEVDWVLALMVACETKKSSHKDRSNHFKIISLISENVIIPEDEHHAMKIACKNYHPECVKYFLSRGIKTSGYDLFAACEGNHRDLIDLLTTDIYRHNSDLENEYWGNIWDFGFIGACQGGHLDLVELLFPKLSSGSRYRASGLVNGMEPACSGGHLEIIKWLIAKDPYISINYWPHHNLAEGIENSKIDELTRLENIKYLMSIGYDQESDTHPLLPIKKWVGNAYLSGACKSGYQKIIDFAISQGANNWDEGLACVCENYDNYTDQSFQETINLLIRSGATRCGEYCDLPLDEHTKTRSKVQYEKQRE